MNEELKKALETISTNKDVEEVKTELAKLQAKPTADEMFNSLQGDETGKKLLDSYADKRVTTGVSSAIENFKKKDLPKAVSDAVKAKEVELEAKYNPTKSPAEKEAEELKARVAELERTNNLTATKAAVTSLFAEKKLPSDFIDLFIVENSEEAVKQATNFADVFNSKVKTEVTSQVEVLLKEHGYDPTVNNEKKGGSGKITQKQLDDAAADARRLGTAEARATYSLLKQQFELQQKT